MWASKAKGLFTKQLVTAAQLAGNDFLLAKYGKDFHTNVQTAHVAGVACMLFYEADPEPYLDWNLDDRDNWDEWKCDDFVNIINAIMVGGINGVPRRVDGVMMDASKVDLPGGKKITAQWIVGYCEWLMNKVYDALKLPIYLYMNRNPINAWKHDTVSIETLYSFIARWEGVSTFDFWVGVGENGVPADNAKPLLPYDDGQPWLFWFYHVDDDGNIDVLHQYDAATLYGVLGFTPAVSGEPYDSGNSGGDGGSEPVVSGKTNELLTAILAELKETNKLLGSSNLLKM